MAGYYVFGGDYSSGMDRGYEPMQVGAQEMPLNKIGISTPPMREQLESLKARIFQGASKVELGFMGMGKGSMQQGAITPEMYGREEREAIRDLAKVNRIELTTHAAPGAVGASGFNPQQGKFSDEHQQNVVNEIRRTIEFAADTARGGPIVVHTGEWHRPFAEAEKADEYKGRFEGYPGEKEKGVIYAVDEKTGQLTGIPKDLEVTQPYADEEGNYKYNEDGTIKMERLGYEELLERAKRDHPEMPEERALITYMNDANLKRHHAEAVRFAKQAEIARKEYDELKSRKEYWAELEKRTPKEKQGILRSSFERSVERKIPEGTSITEFFEKQMRVAQREIDWAEEISASSSQSVESAREDIKRIKPVEEVGLKRTANAVSEMAMYAYDVEQMKNLKKSLYISPENIFPESGYGSHPQELKKLIIESRKAMADKLKTRGFAEERAKKIAEDHVKATFDIGHAYTWRRFFKGSDPADIEKTNKEFKKWAMDQVKDLLKSKVIGRAHISDNFGYYDEHVTPGQGIVPVKEFVEELKKADVEDVVVEPAHQDIQALLGAWEHFGSSIYSAMAPWESMDRWIASTSVYAGRTAGPNYLVGDVVPSEDWTLWSQTRME